MTFTRLAAPALALIVAIAVIVMVNTAQLQHVGMVTAAGMEPAAFDPKSPTGYAGNTRTLLLPEHGTAGYQWIAQEQGAAARGEWRVRHVDYDNAPFGRTVLSPSPYRWWLGMVGRCRNLFTPGPLPTNIERGALVADPVLQALALLLLGVFSAIEFGAAAAAMLIIAAAFVFPFSATFLAAQSNDAGLTLLVTLGTLLTTVAAVRATESARATARGISRRYVTAGVMAGLTLWLNAAVGTMTALLLASAAVAAEVSAGPAAAGRSERGRHWLELATAAAATVLMAAVIEYFPDHLDGAHLEFVHPLYAAGWLGLGGLVWWTHETFALRHIAWRWRPLAALAVSAAAVGTVIVVGWRNGSFAVAWDAFALNATHLEHATGSESLWTWLARTGAGPTAWAAVAPLSAIVAAAWVCWRRRNRPALLIAVLVAVGAFVLAACRLGWSGFAAVAAIGVVAPLVEATALSVRGRCIWAAVALLLTVFGAWLLRGQVSASPMLSETEVVSLVERDFSQWLAGRAGPGGAVVLAPPSLSVSLYYHGGLRVLGTPYWENKDGMQAAVRLAAASSPDEGLALAGKREVKFIALPSWDDALDRLVRLTSNSPDKSLLGLLHQWQAPRWLRPLPYPLPAIPGFEGRSVAVFEVVDVQDPATALSRLAECFIEMGRLDDAGKVASALAHAFPADLGGRVARANVAAAYGDADKLAEDMQVLTNAESLANAVTLPWDRQISYAVALAQGQRLDLAKQVAGKAIAEIDEAKLRFLTPQALYRLQLLCKVSGLEIADPRLRTLARELLPPEIRDKV